MAITRARTSSVAQGPSTSKSFLANNPVILGGSYESIATVTVGSGGATTVEFTSIPATYTHLQVRLNIRSNRAVTVEAYSLQFNSTGSNQYSGHLLAGGGATTQIYSETGQNVGLGAYISGDSAGSNMFGGAISDILDYANTNKYKTVRSLGGTDQNGSGNISFTSCLWQNTAAINSIKFLSGGTGWTQYSSFALYGIK